MTALIPLYLATGFWFVIGPAIVGLVLGIPLGIITDRFWLRRRRHW
jgi:hypothetical protein